MAAALAVETVQGKGPAALAILAGLAFAAFAAWWLGGGGGGNRGGRR